jgi:uncharacterized repeat protein (TIGR01451 family)
MRHLFTLFCSYYLFSHSLFAQVSWVPTLGPEGSRILWIFKNDEYIFHTDNLFFYRTSDGENWERFDRENLFPIVAYGSKLVAFEYLGPHVVPNTQLVISYNNGETWTEAALPAGYEYPMGVTSDKIYVEGDNQHTGILYQSDDDGLTWSTLPIPGKAEEFKTFDDRLYLIGSNNIWRLNLDGITWKKITPGLSSSQDISGFFKEDSIMCFRVNNNIYTSSDDGQTWRNRLIPSQSAGSFVKIGDRIYSDASLDGFMLYSDDLGDTWQDYQVTNPINNYTIAELNDRIIVSAYNKGMFVLDTTDRTLKLANNGLASGIVHDLVPGADRLWAACENGIFSYDLVQQQWDTVSRVPTSLSRYSNIVLSPNGSIATVDDAINTVYVSTDNGITWQSSQPDTHVEKLHWDGEILYAADHGNNSFVTTDYGLTWSESIRLPKSNIIYFNGKYYGANYINVLSATSMGGPWAPEPNSPSNPSYFFKTEDRIFCLHQDQYNQTALSTSTDGATWQYVGDGLSYSIGSPTFNGSIFEKDGRYYFISSIVDGIYVSLDTLNTWLPIDRNYHANFVAVDSTIYAHSHGSGVIRTAIPDSYSAISMGRVFKDDNDNNQFDPGELPIVNNKVTMYERGSWYASWHDFTDTEGFYSLSSLPNSSDTITTQVNSAYVEYITPPFHAVTNSGTGRDFAVKFFDDITDAAVTHMILGVPRPGFESDCRIVVSNVGTIPLNGKLGVLFPSNYQVLSASPPPNEVYGDSLVWHIADLAIFGDSAILVHGKVDSSAMIEDCILVRSTFYTNAQDAAPDNNVYSSCTTIKGTFDPIEKYVEPAEGLTRVEILAGKELIYTVRFQNTGNGPAERVRITDHLDSKLDWQTFRLIDASHEITTMQILPTGLLEVIFDQINLPDSTSNEPASHGFIRFGIQRKKTFSDYEKIENRALIYFDANEPAITNTVVTPLRADPISTDEKIPARPVTPTLQIVPNPAHALCVVTNSGALEGKGELLVTDVLGRLVYRQPVARLEVPLTLKLHDYSSGTYFVQMIGAKGRISGKLVVE